MAGVSFDYSASGFSSRRASEQAASLREYMADLELIVQSKNFSHPAASIVLPSSKKYLEQSLALCRSIPKPSLIIVAGIGGSNLGALAASQAVLGSYHNLLSEPQIVYADTTDAGSIHSIIELGRRHLSKGKDVLLNVISKSGSTLETMANFSAIHCALSKPGGRHLHVVATSDERSALERYARANGHATLPLPKAVGGRYSVFSNAGLFPLAAAGVNVKALLDGARKMRDQCLSRKASDNPAMQMAALLYLHNQAGRRIHDHFLFSNDMAGLGLWYRQLLAESIGKELALSGQPVHAGITPTLSIGSTDLHSMAQLYLGGPSDKFFRLVCVKSARRDIVLPKNEMLGALAPSASGRKLSRILSSIYGGACAAFRARSIPFVSVTLSDLSEESVGMLMQEEMMETIYLAQLLSVNAFDQPAVELYKKEAAKLL